MEATTNGITSWTELNLNELVAERTADATQAKSELPAGNYKFRFVTAKQNPFEAGTTDIDLVVTEGPHARRHLFAKIPAPSVTKYAAQWAGTLIKTLGGTAQPGEDLISFLNRIGPSAGPFTADVIMDTWNDKNTNELRSKPKLQFFSLQPAA